MKNIAAFAVFVIGLGVGGLAEAGPYTECGIASYVGPDRRPTTPWDVNGVLNPIFRGWATGIVNYEPAFGVDSDWSNSEMALGPSYSNTVESGHIFDIVSLGELEQEDIAAGAPAGRITLSFGETIADGSGYDFVVFENSQRWGDLYFCELAYVEVSSNGSDFARFAPVSLAPYDSGGPIIPNYRCIDITDVYNLAGKHINLGDEFTGTPFDLNELAGEPNVLNGSVNLGNINYVRIVDIPGSGDFKDRATELIDPCTWPGWGYYDTNHPVYDAWPTYGSGGMDLEAIGVLHPQEYEGDINLDGIVDYEDLEKFAQAWLGHFGQDNYLAKCDIAQPRDLIVDFKDFAVFSQDWLKTEQWRND